MSQFFVNTPITYTAVAATQGWPSDTFAYAWVFDDGGTGNTASLSHTWTTLGQHSATVTATDTLTGGSATQSKTITLNSIPPISTRPFLEYGNVTNRTFWEFNNGASILATVAGSYYIPAPLEVTTDGLVYTSPGTLNALQAQFGRLAVSSDGVHVLATSVASWTYAVSNNSGASFTTMDNSATYFQLGDAVCNADMSVIIATATISVGHAFIARSTDRGTTFAGNQQIWFYPVDQFACGPLVASKTFDRVLAVGRVLLTSIDAGVTWTEGPATPFSSYMASCVCASDTLDRVYASYNNQFYVSTNYGVTWTMLMDPGGSLFDISCSGDGLTVTMSANVSSTPKIFKSINGGVTWTTIVSGSNAGNNTYITRDGTKIFTILSSVLNPNRFRPTVSFDGGVTWY